MSDFSSSEIPNRSDPISRQAAIEEIQGFYPPKVPNESEAEAINRVGWECALNCIEAYLRTVKPVDPVKHGKWIPCSERLPEEDVEVLITYRYKDGEGDTSHAHIDITSYGQMYFGGNKVGVHKHWRAPFEYFESNYEVIAWMPLPEPYKENEDE